jgi:hypothetical protein
LLLVDQLTPTLVTHQAARGALSAPVRGAAVGAPGAEASRLEHRQRRQAPHCRGSAIDRSGIRRSSSRGNALLRLTRICSSSPVCCTRIARVVAMWHPLDN